MIWFSEVVWLGFMGLVGFIGLVRLVGLVSLGGMVGRFGSRSVGLVGLVIEVASVIELSEASGRVAFREGRDLVS